VRGFATRVPLPSVRLKARFCHSDPTDALPIVLIPIVLIPIVLIPIVFVPLGQQNLAYRFWFANSDLPILAC